MAAACEERSIRRTIARHSARVPPWPPHSHFTTVELRRRLSSRADILSRMQRTLCMWANVVAMFRRFGARRLCPPDLGTEKIQQHLVDALVSGTPRRAPAPDRPADGDRGWSKSRPARQPSACPSRPSHVSVAEERSRSRSRLTQFRVPWPPGLRLSHSANQRWLSPDGFPARRFSTLISSSRSGQCIPRP